MKRITSDKIETIAKKLRLMPAVSKKKPVEYSRQEAITMLRAEIAALEKRGYSLEQVSETLRGEGLEINTATLRTYLQKAGDGKQTAAAVTVAPAKKKKTIAKAVTVAKSKLSAAKAKKPKLASDATPAKSPAYGATFELRPDTDDI